MANNFVDPELSSERVNQGEDKHFLRTALTWQGSVTPQVLPRVIVASAYSALIVLLSSYFDKFSLEITPFEYSGAVIGLILVARMNAGMDRWWEARKMWGSIVNASRNLATIGIQYLPGKNPLEGPFLRWVAAWPHVMRESLRRQDKLQETLALLGPEDTDRVRKSEHMPTYVGFRIAKLLAEMRQSGLDDFAFTRAERERALLIDSVGGCERILNTPIPLVLAITTRRFIFLFLLLLPLALIERAGWLTPLVVALTSYPLLSLEEIGAELQNPFSPRNLSHLPLKNICAKIEENVMSLENAE